MGKKAPRAAMTIDRARLVSTLVRDLDTIRGLEIKALVEATRKPGTQDVRIVEDKTTGSRARGN